MSTLFSTTQVNLREIRVRLWPLLRWSPLLLVLIAISGLAYQQWAEVRDLERFPAPGQLLMVGDGAMHLDCRGEGSPMVLLEAAAQGDSLDWFRIHDQLAAITRTCAYDRRGLGWSDTVSGPRAAEQIIGDLVELLQVAGESGPYLLVGHGQGGIYARAFVHRYSDYAAGLVLIDSSHEDNPREMPDEILALRARWQDLDAVCQWLAPFGWYRLTGGLSPSGLPEEIAGAATAISNQSHLCRMRLRYSRGLPDSLALVRAMGDLGDLPILVLTQGHEPTVQDVPPGLSLRTMREAFAVHQRTQARQLGLSSRSRQVVVPDAGHFVHWDRPDVVIEQISREIYSYRLRGR
jgi:pimeloyl-ACP methyl ester carboxylesterase